MPPLDILIPILKEHVLVGGLFAGLVLLLLGQPWSRSEKASQAWIGALALGGAYIASHALSPNFGLKWIPKEAKHWWPYTLGLTVCFVVAEGLWSQRSTLKHSLRFLFGGIVHYLNFRGAVLEYEWGPKTGSLIIAGIALVQTILWAVCEGQAKRHRSADIPIAWIVSCLCMAKVLEVAGLAVGGSVEATLCGGLGAAMLLAFWRPERSQGTGMAAPFVVVQTSLGAVGYVYAQNFVEMSVWILPLLGVSILAASLPAGSSPGKRILLRTTWVAIPGIAAVVLAYLTAPEDPSGYYGY